MILTFLNILAAVAFLLGAYMSALSYVASRDRGDPVAPVMSPALSILLCCVVLCAGARLPLPFRSPCLPFPPSSFILVRSSCIMVTELFWSSD